MSAKGRNLSENAREYIGEGSGQVVLKLLPGSYSFEVKKEYPIAGKKRKKGEIARSKGTH